METNKFSQLLLLISEMDHRQRSALQDALSHVSDETKVIESIESNFDADGKCPFCRHDHFYRHGFASGLQRYRCMSCKISFNALTGTPLARLRHKNKWLNYLNALAESLSIRKAATIVGINRKTSFRWRHRFLTWMASDHPVALHGITEADETYLLESQKGSRHINRKPRKRGGSASKRGLSKEQICILIARDRAGGTVDFITGRGPVSSTGLRRSLKPVLDVDAILVSDGHSAYKTFCQSEGFSHEVINLSIGERVKGAFHLQNVNAYHSRFKAWLKRFHGVATKYLPNYLGWRRSFEQHPMISPESLLKIALGGFQQLKGT
jgi:transposase-like protein